MHNLSRFIRIAGVSIGGVILAITATKSTEPNLRQLQPPAQQQTAPQQLPADSALDSIVGDSTMMLIPGAGADSILARIVRTDSGYKVVLTTYDILQSNSPSYQR